MQAPPTHQHAAGRVGDKEGVGHPHICTPKDAESSRATPYARGGVEDDVMDLHAPALHAQRGLYLEARQSE